MCVNCLKTILQVSASKANIDKALAFLKSVIDAIASKTSLDFQERSTLVIMLSREKSSNYAIGRFMQSARFFEITPNVSKF